MGILNGVYEMHHFSISINELNYNFIWNSVYISSNVLKRPLFVREQNTQKTAKSLGLVGWVRNTERKTVEGVAQGKEEKLAEMWVYGWW